MAANGAHASRCQLHGPVDSWHHCRRVAIVPARSVKERGNAGSRFTVATLRDCLTPPPAFQKECLMLPTRGIGF